MLKRTMMIAAVAAVVSMPAFAGSCPKHMAAIDEALAANPQLAEEQLAEVKRLREEGAAHHEAGRHAESMAALTEAERILGISG